MEYLEIINNNIFVPLCTIATYVLGVIFLLIINARVKEELSKEKSKKFSESIKVLVLAAGGIILVIGFISAYVYATSSITGLSPAQVLGFW